MKHPLDEMLLPQSVRNLCNPLVPKSKKIIFASGLVTLPPEDTALLLYQLAFEQDAEISAKAADTLKNMPHSLVAAGVSKLKWPEPIDYIAKQFASSKEIIQEALKNSVTDNSTILEIAKTCSKEIADIIASNQVRLLECPQIIEALYYNRNTRMSTVDRIVSFAIRNNVQLNGITAFKEIAVSYESAEKAEKIALQPNAQRMEFDSDYDENFDDVLISGQEEFADFSSGSSGIFGEFDEEGGGGSNIFGAFDESISAGGGGNLFSEFDETAGKQKKESDKKDEEKLPLELKISKMPVAHKIRLATIGTSVHRSILLQDSNKLVAMAAIKSPGVSEQEVVKYSQSRSVSVEVIRYIAENRHWTKNRFIKINLVNNPKTPLSASMSFLSSLNKNELKTVAMNKNIPTALRNQAASILKRFEGGQK